MDCMVGSSRDKCQQRPYDLHLSCAVFQTCRYTKRSVVACPQHAREMLVGGYTHPSGRPRFVACAGGCGALFCGRHSVDGRFVSASGHCFSCLPRARSTCMEVLCAARLHLVLDEMVVDYLGLRGRRQPCMPGARGGDGCVAAKRARLLQKISRQFVQPRPPEGWVTRRRSAPPRAIANLVLDFAAAEKCRGPCPAVYRPSCLVLYGSPTPRAEFRAEMQREGLVLWLPPSKAQEEGAPMESNQPVLGDEWRNYRGFWLRLGGSRSVPVQE